MEGVDVDATRLKNQDIEDDISQHEANIEDLVYIARKSIDENSTERVGNVKSADRGVKRRYDGSAAVRINVFKICQENANLLI